MITAIIRNKENTLVLELPHSIYDIYEKLQSIGIMQPPKRIPLTDNEDEDIGVKLFSESDFGRHLLLTLHEKNTIADANMLTLVIGAASEDIKEELEQNVLYDQYDSMDEVISAVRQMTQDAGPVKAVFFCPLVGNIDEGDGDKPLYLYSLKEAAEWDEKVEWSESYLENCDCARAIERAIDEHYDGQCLKSCAKEIIDRYGFDRVNFVLAATVRQGTHDGRYSEDNKKWSRRFSVMDKENAWQYHVRSHPGLVNLFVADARRLWDKLGLFDGRHCENGSQVDYTDRIVVLDPSILKDECKTPQDQLFYAESGNGCRPDSLGTKVFGFHVSDGEKGYYRRTDFIGALKEEFVPEWAQENTQKYLEADDLADEPDEDGGMTMNTPSDDGAVGATRH